MSFAGGLAYTTRGRIMTKRDAAKAVHDDFVTKVRRPIPDYFLERNRTRAWATHLASCETCRDAEASGFREMDPSDAEECDSMRERIPR